MTNTQDTQDTAVEMAHEIIASYPDANALQIGLAAAAVIAIITEEFGNGDFAITVGRTLIECGEQENAKARN